MKQTICYLCTLLLFVPVLLGKEIQGRYTPLEGKSPLVAGSLTTVRVVEVLSFTCPHCYYFHNNLDSFQEKYGDKLIISHLPIGYAGINPAKLYFIALENDKGKEVKELLFQSFHDSGIRNLNHPNIINTLAKIAGIEQKYEQQKNSSAILDKIKFVKIFASKNNIRSTPTFVIENSILVVGADIDNLSLVLDSLLKE